MRIYGKFLLIALIWGVCFSLIVLTKDSGEVYLLEDLVISIGFGNLKSCDQITMINLLEGMVPYYVFTILFGTYIYRHFCWSSPYIFSRCEKRRQWMYQEAGRLFLFSSLYMLFFIAGRILPVIFYSNICINKTGLEMLLLLYGIMTFWIFSMSFFCNILSIWKGSVWGTTGALAVNTILVLNMIFIRTEELTEKEIIKLRLNYCSHLVFGWHIFPDRNIEGMDQLGAGISFLESYAYVLIVAIIMIMIGGYVVEKTDILINKEEER